MNLKKELLSIISILSIFISCGAVLNFKSVNFYGTSADLFDWSSHPCNRKCYNNEEPMTCHYIFVVEKYSSMSKACYNCTSVESDCFRPHCIPADGVQKNVYVVNRMLPGPTIEVCQGDTIVVDVQNELLSESTTIHWHGVNQKDTPYADGVSYVTQCPIPPQAKFRYEFNANIHGTYFWHSHQGNQRADGLFGALIIHPKDKNNLLYGKYDVDDHLMIVTDWSHEDGDTVMTRSIHGSLMVPTNILVNGLGRQIETIQNEEATFAPHAIFHVKKGSRYRFRLIDAGSEDCPIEMSIDSHKMTVISLDSQDVEPVTVDRITIWPGERVDFILVANQEIDNYWIRFRGYVLCQNSTDNTTGVYQVAVLRYDDAPDSHPLAPIGYDIPQHTPETRILNPYEKETEPPTFTSINIPQLTSLLPNDASLAKTVDIQIYISFDFYPIDNFEFHRKNLYGYNQVSNDQRYESLQFNHISLKLQPFPLLSQREMITPGTFCNASTISPRCQIEHCACTHVLEVNLNEVVELVLVDGGNSTLSVSHPLHLHGHFFRVVATENLEGLVSIDRVRRLDREGKIKRRLNRAPFKDTMKAPGGGYTVVRFHADNPGYWLFHCHMDTHANTGMALVFKVGHHKEMAPVPYNFPRCGNYQPEIGNSFLLGINNWELGW